MAESTLFDTYLGNIRDTLFGEKKSPRNVEKEYILPDGTVYEPYYDKAYLDEREGVRVNREQGTTFSGPDPDQIHYEQIQERNSFNDWFNLDSVAKIESNNMGDARSKSGALGYFQIKPHVAKDPGYGIKPLVTVDGTYTEDDILNTPRERQEDFVYSYLKQAKFIFKDDKPKTILSYLEGIPGTKNIASGKKKISTQGIGYLEKYMLNGDLKKQEILKSFPQLKNNPKFGNMIREDGTKKSSTGWLGPIKHEDGKTMTEVSVNFDDVLDGAEIPLIVPTLTNKEINILRKTNIRTGTIPKSIINKAIKHALERDAQGLSPFYSDSEGRKK